MHIDSRIVNPPSCLTCRRAGRMAIHAMEARGFHSKPPSCLACRATGRMAIHTMEAKGFHSKSIHDLLYFL